MFSCLSRTRCEPSPCGLCALRRCRPPAPSTRASYTIPSLRHASRSPAISFASPLGTSRADVSSKVVYVHGVFACKPAAVCYVAAAFAAFPLPCCGHVPEAPLAVRRRQLCQLAPVRPQLGTPPRSSSYRCSSRISSSPFATVSTLPMYVSGKPAKPEGNGELCSVCGGPRTGAVY